MKHFPLWIRMFLFLVCCSSYMTMAQDEEEFIFYIQSVRYPGMYFDIEGQHYSAKTHDAQLQLHEKENYADRAIRVIPCPESPQFVYLQPMHSHFVLGLSDSALLAGAESSVELLLQEKELGGKAVRFELLAVPDKHETYRLKLGELFLSASSPGKLLAQPEDGSTAQEWIFEFVGIHDLEPYPIASNTGAYYKLRPVSNRSLYTDIPEYNMIFNGMNTKYPFLESKHQSNFTEVEVYRNFEYNEVSGPLQLYHDEIPNGGDRFIEVIPHRDSSGFVYLRTCYSMNKLKVSYGGEDAKMYLSERARYSNVDEWLFRPILIYNDNKEQHYLLQSKKNGLYLTAGQNGEPISCQKYTGDKNQHWFFDEVKNYKVFALQNMESGGFLDLPESGYNSAKEGNRFSLTDLPNLNDNYFRLHVRERTSWVHIQPLNSTKVLDIKRGSTEDGAELLLWSKHDGNNQRFKFVYAGSPMTFFIINNKSNKALSVSGDGKIVQVQRNDNDKRQQWKLHELQDIFVTPPQGQKFYVKRAFSERYVSQVNTVGHALNTTATSKANAGVFVFESTGNWKWQYMHTGDPNKRVSSAYVNRMNNDPVFITLKHSVRSGKHKHPQCFTLEATSPGTFVFRTFCNEAIGLNGTTLFQKRLNYEVDQQFQLIYADGPKQGQVYQFFDKQTFTPNN